MENKVISTEYVKKKIEEIINYIKFNVDYFEKTVPDDIEDVKNEYVLREDIDYIEEMLQKLLEETENG